MEKQQSFPIAEFIEKEAATGTFNEAQDPKQLLDALNARADRPAGLNGFLVTSEDPLNEMSPIEVLAQRPFTEAERDMEACQWRMLNYSMDLRVSKVVAVARMKQLEQAEGLV